ncbi:hypothetical protein COCSUDRAFT_60559 [Coccomyxa subellipsoidea C-169]|uniref:Uncharacterized protein n=1 Tax=Coccomyxa subellipsoidea (strain C-169) TaxID=574566 RepID=I0YIH2_COCSC|nr:hypothetical protein COCSUDRAFT_60559 [Coccomyxa subellipsoidea C-169]EIE18191.1 hypothetical protein COCSUDRAFT_60559 [Coccomyxa subellipsoidea C-169]|eukprot:XP_005642735.1 hypothetical protein COCSUDRAFT_60559 [Coccomyxa subellipsoidea C-169]
MKPQMRRKTGRAQAEATWLGVHELAAPEAAGLWDCHAATWAAVTGETAPPRSTDLLLADDTRVWEPPRQLRPLWQRLRLATICQLWAAYQAYRPSSAGRPHIARAARSPHLVFLQEGSPGRLATCHPQHPAVSGRAQRLAPGTRPHTQPGGVHIDFTRFLHRYTSIFKFLTCIV